MTKKESIRLFNSLFSESDQLHNLGLPIPGTAEWKRREARYTARLARIRPQDVYRIPIGMAVRIIRYDAEKEQFYCTCLHDNRRRLVDAADIIEGSFLGRRYKKKNDPDYAKPRIPGIELYRHGQRIL